MCKFTCLCLYREKPWLCPVGDCDFRCSLSHNLKQHLDCVHRDCINSFPSAQQDGLGVQTEASSQFQSWLAIQKHKWRDLRGDEWQIPDQLPLAPRIAHGNQSNDERWLLQYEALVAWGEDPNGGRGKTCEVPHGARYHQMQLGTWLQNQARATTCPLLHSHHLTLTASLSHAVSLLRSCYRATSNDQLVIDRKPT